MQKKVAARVLPLPMLLLSLATLGFCGVQGEEPATVFTLGTFNLANYTGQTLGTQPAKSAESQASVRRAIRALQADVLALQEMGSTNMVLELLSALRQEGLHYGYWEHVRAHDPVLHLSVFSRFPITQRHSHTNETYLLQGRRHAVRRGFLQVEIQVNEQYQFTLLAAHLKSRREVVEADQADLRQEEALLLRARVEALLMKNPRLNLAVVGDLNDTKDSKPIRTLIGRGSRGLVDTRPGERPGPGEPASNVSWTYHFGRSDTYDRVDYILLSKGMAAEWLAEKSHVLAMPDWALASDHRPVVITLKAAEEKPPAK